MHSDAYPGSDAFEGGCPMNDARYATVELGVAHVLRVGVTYGADAQPKYIHFATGSDLRRNSDANSEHRAGDSYATTK